MFCGFGGNDSIVILNEGDIFLGGMGNDYVNVNDSAGTFNGGDGIDYVYFNYDTQGAVLNSVEVGPA